MKLHKRGRMLVASYEAVRCQKLDLFSVTLRQIGAHISRMHLEDAIEVLMEGDGNGNAAAVDSTATEGTLTYEDLVDFWAKFDPYEMNTLLVAGDVMVKLLKLDGVPEPPHWAELPGHRQADHPPGGQPAAHLRPCLPGPPSAWTGGSPWRWCRAAMCWWSTTSSSTGSWSGRPSPLSAASPSCSRARPGCWRCEMEEQILAFVELMGGRGT